MAGPRWLEDVRRQKVVEQEPNDVERIRGDFLELRLRYIKVVGDNIILRNALAVQKRQRRHPSRTYEQEHEISPGIGDDYDEDVVEFSQRMQRHREDW